MSTESLEATDEYGAYNATAPRVSLADIEAKIAEKYFFTAGEALTAMTSELGYMQTSTPLSRLTICILVMDNGFTVVGKSAPASPENFSEEKGKTFAYEDAIRQLWPLEGYALRERLAAA